MTGSTNSAANDDEAEQIDLDPRSRTFYSEATAVAAYLIGNGKSLASSRCLTTVAIMFHCMAAARENRMCTVSEIQNALAEASRNISHHEVNATFFASTAHDVANINVEVSADA